MCGIAGTFGLPDPVRIKAMTAVLSHRGPDDEGVNVFPEEGVGLGHRRLSIIDLSSAGHQPMSNDDESVWLTFNGEIYNFKELKEGLERRGAHFKSRTDTEVIIRLYEEQGIECFRQLNGMFALALLDRRRKTLILARDHLGVKPLYYHHGNGKLLFASEIKGILASGAYSPEINWQGVHDYFTYLYVPCPETVFRDIYQVPPAHFLELDLKTNQVSLTRYWQVAQTVNGNGHPNDYAQAQQELRNLLNDAVRHQMIADVPLGVFLSGGVDSPVLTGLMAGHSAQAVKTFTVVFQGRNLEYHNEEKEARAVAAKFGTLHREIAVDISQPLAMLNLVEHFDQPFGNPTFYLMYLISKAAQTDVTVALSGAGGDELFAGYPRYKAMGLAKWLHWLPPAALSGTQRVLGLMKDDYSSAMLRRAREFVGGLDADFAREFVNWTYFLSDAEKQLLLKARARSAVSGENGGFLPADRIVRRFFEESGLAEEGNRVLHLDVQTFLPDNILEYTDKMSMAVSLEVRVPYLDYRVVEHSLSSPFNFKFRSGKGKVILKETFADLLPPENIHAKKKGFNFPLAVWMRDYFDQYFVTQMNPETVARHGLFDSGYINLLREQHRAGKRDNSYPLFSIVMFDVWYRKYILGEAV